ncbi:MAG: ferredoxin [Planctomycetota bacterium]|jgi:ferredoxin
MKVRLNPDLCSGSGLCVDTCPEVFELNDEGVSKVKMEQIPTEYQQSCKEAADNCPTEAISLEE